MTRPPLLVHDLGSTPYGEALEQQRALCQRRVSGDLREDLLLFVEHPPVYTLGRGTQSSSLPASANELRRSGAEVFEIERGGDVTFHGPGQLVGYPILDLSHHRQDLHWYLRTLEASLIDALLTFGLEAERNEGLTGVWLQGRKIASIGVHVKRWVTFHGFALNVTTDLGWFDAIVPCGIQNVTMTSIARELGTTPAASELGARSRAATANALANQFNREVEFISALP